MGRSIILLLVILLRLPLSSSVARDVFDYEPIDVGPSQVASRSSATGKIVGGSVADPQRYEYFTLLRVFQQDKRILRCAGSLIHEDIILTVAHCAHEQVDRMVAWVNYTRDDGLTSYEHRATVEKWFPHPDYNSSTGENDVAILKLTRPIHGVKPVTFDTLAIIPLDNQFATVFGFGRTEADGSFPDELMDVNVKIVPQDKCNSKRSYNGKIVEESMLCAGVDGGGKDACGGDSGAPLVISGGTASLDLQIGIVSWGRGCAEARFPGRRS
jgi:secreted trypsin-like serine protease